MTTPFFLKSKIHLTTDTWEAKSSGLYFLRGWAPVGAIGGMYFKTIQNQLTLLL